jgi:hypothetical protein
MNLCDIKRGRPAGRLTIRRRQVLDYAMRCEAKGEALVLGKLIRTVGLHDRTVAKRILNDLKKMGLLFSA